MDPHSKYTGKICHLIYITRSSYTYIRGNTVRRSCFCSPPDLTHSCDHRTSTSCLKHCAISEAPGIFLRSLLFVVKKSIASLSVCFHMLPNNILWPLGLWTSLFLGNQLDRSESSTVPAPSEPHLEQAETFQTRSGPLLGVPWARKRQPINFKLSWNWYFTKLLMKRNPSTFLAIVFSL